VGSREIIVRVLPGELPRRGAVVERDKSPSASVVVRWDDGTDERVRPGDRSVGYASEGSVCAQWLLEPGTAAEAFGADPLRVFTEFIRDTGKITKTMLLRRIVVAGVSESQVVAEYKESRAGLRANRHIQITSDSHTWSDTPIDPYADLRGLAPHEALDRLAEVKGLRAPQRLALADAVRAGLPSRT
jgi:hypothetical protein